MRRLVHRLYVGGGDQRPNPQSVKTSHIVAREDRHHAGRRLGLAAVDAADPGMRVRRAQKIGPGLAVLADIVGEASGTGEKAVVLLAANRLPDAGKIAGAHGYFPIAAAPCFTALTIL